MLFGSWEEAIGNPDWVAVRSTVEGDVIGESFPELDSSMAKLQPKAVDQIGRWRTAFGERRCDMGWEKRVALW